MPLPRVTSVTHMTLPRCEISCFASKDWTLQGPSQPRGTSGERYNR
ncbi:unknown ORF [Mungbean yellow mosaic virus]|nr:unknown ORF [Mungbean yellow mosaic virus]